MGLATRSLAAVAPTLVHYVVVASMFLFLLGFLLVVATGDKLPPGGSGPTRYVEEGVGYIMTEYVIGGIVAAWNFDLMQGAPLFGVPGGGHVNYSYLSAEQFLLGFCKVKSLPTSRQALGQAPIPSRAYYAAFSHAHTPNLRR